MIRKRCFTRSSTSGVRSWQVLCVLGAAATLSFSGCEALNPAFVDLLDPEGTGQYTVLDNPSGHVIFAFVNDVEVDERLIDYLENQGGVELTDADKQYLHPRIRLRATVTFTDGNVLNIDFEDGSTTLIEQAFEDQSAGDLEASNLTNRVGVCDVASVVIPLGNVEVFIPVEITRFEAIEVTNDAGTVVGITYQARNRDAPQFRGLRIDDTDANGRVTQRRNVDPRNVPSLVTDPACGSVITVILGGSLTVPFLPEAGTAAPSYDQADVATEASIGGQYWFTIDVR